MSHLVKCVFVHGWGMNSAVWQSCVEQLPDWVEAETIDMPGCGSQPMGNVSDFDSLINSVSESVLKLGVDSEPVILIGWSLGGLVCMKIAERYPERISGLCLVSSTPCFVKKTGWKTAIEKDVFNEFASALSMDIKKTIGRFLALQVAGSETSKITLKQLRATLEESGLATREALELGLQVLSTVDLRENLKHLNVPVQWVFGDKDKLVPVDIVEAIKPLSPESGSAFSEISVIEGAAHAPFLSHRDQFLNILNDFVTRVK